MPKISIIIPVFNVEKYLEDCLNSILQQEFKDYEIILVNDGSTDNSGEICNKYSTQYPFIKTVHKNNGGLSEARNVGIDVCIGEYIIFVDSDDMIYRNSLEMIHQTILEDLKVDVIFLEADKLFPDGTTIPLGDGYNKSKIYMQSHSAVLKHISSLPKFPGSACTKLVKRSLLIENDLFFEKGLLSEDIDWTLRLLSVAKVYNYCEHKYYYYRQFRNGSITNNIGLRNVLSLLHIIKKWSSNPKDGKDIGIHNEIYAFLAYEYLVLLSNYSLLKSEDKKEIKMEVREYSWLFKYNKTRKVRIVKALYKIFGFEITANILNLYQLNRYK